MFFSFCTQFKWHVKVMKNCALTFLFNYCTNITRVNFYEDRTVHKTQPKQYSNLCNKLINA